MKRRRLKVQVTEEQQLLIAIVLVLLLAISMLYCLGFASLALHQAWESGPLPWEGTGLPEESLDTTPLPPAAEPITPTITLP